MKNKLRVIGGKWRSRIVTFTELSGLRPTPGRVRETLFNWLQYDVVGSRCLDLYAGSGALGFEAESRGAAQVVEVEKNPSACRSLEENIAALKAERMSVVCSGVMEFLESRPSLFDLVFLDPPFGCNLVGETCRLLEARGWLAENAKIYIEFASNRPLSDLPENWSELKNKKAGEVGYCLFQRSVPDVR